VTDFACCIQTFNPFLIHSCEWETPACWCALELHRKQADLFSPFKRSGVRLTALAPYARRSLPLGTGRGSRVADRGRAVGERA
jgi:hypothetical protein